VARAHASRSGCDALSGRSKSKRRLARSETRIGAPLALVGTRRESAELIHLQLEAEASRCYTRTPPSGLLRCGAAAALADHSGIMLPTWTVGISRSRQADPALRASRSDHFNRRDRNKGFALGAAGSWKSRYPAKNCWNRHGSRAVPVSHGKTLRVLVGTTPAAVELIAVRRRLATP